MTIFVALARKTAALLWLMTIAQTCAAHSHDHRYSPVNEWQIEFALGPWWQNNPLREATTTVHYVMPHWSYYGERVFIENFTLGFALNENRHHRLALLATPSDDYGYFYFADHKAHALAQPRERPAADIIIATHDTPFHYLAGFEYSYFGDNWQASVNALGNSGAGRDYWISQWQISRDWSWRSWRIETALQARFNSAAYVDQYYAAEVYGTFRSTHYGGKKTWSPAAALAVEYTIDQHWSWLAHYRVQKLGEGIANSPLIAHSTVRQLFTGLLFSY